MGQESLDIAPAFARQKALTVRAEQHTKVAGELDEAGAGIEEMLHQSRRSKETLTSLELKLQRLRHQLRPAEAGRFEIGANLTKAAGSGSGSRDAPAASKRRALDMITEEIDRARQIGEELHTCPYCGSTLLGAMSMTHTVECERRAAARAGGPAVHALVSGGASLLHGGSSSQSLEGGWSSRGGRGSPEHMAVDTAGSSVVRFGGVATHGHAAPSSYPTHGLGAVTGSPVRSRAAQPASGGGGARAPSPPSGRSGGRGVAGEAAADAGGLGGTGWSSAGAGAGGGGPSYERMGSSTSGPQSTLSDEVDESVIDTVIAVEPETCAGGGAAGTKAPEGAGFKSGSRAGRGRGGQSAGAAGSRRYGESPDAPLLAAGSRSGGGASAAAALAAAVGSAGRGGGPGGHRGGGAGGDGSVGGGDGAEEYDSDEDGPAFEPDSDLEDNVTDGRGLPDDRGSGGRSRGGGGGGGATPGVGSVRSSRFRSSRTAAAQALTECPTCRRRYPTARFQKHAAGCRQRQVLAAAVSALGDELEHAFVPQPPTNLRVLSVTAISISLAWTPPIFDGGALITAYEVSHWRRTFKGSGRRGRPGSPDRRGDGFGLEEGSAFGASLSSAFGGSLGSGGGGGGGSGSFDSGAYSGGGRGRVVESDDYIDEELPLVSTAFEAEGVDILTAAVGGAARGGLAAAALNTGRVGTDDSLGESAGGGGDGGGSPRLLVAKRGQAVTAPRGITLNGLEPNAEYRYFKVRAVNRAGPSLWSNEVLSVRTKQPKPPGAPTRLRVTARASDSLTLAWEPPASTGGGKLLGYELSFEELAAKPAGGPPGRASGGAGEGEVQVVAVPPDATTWVLSGLRGSTRYANITLVAVNAARLRSPPSAGTAGETLRLSREQEVLLELEGLYAAAKRDQAAAAAGDGGAGGGAYGSASAAFGDAGARAGSGGGGSTAAAEGGGEAPPPAWDVEVEVVYQRAFQRMRRSRYIALLERELSGIRRMTGGTASAAAGSADPSRPGTASELRQSSRPGTAGGLRSPSRPGRLASAGGHRGSDGDNVGGVPATPSGLPIADGPLTPDSDASGSGGGGGFSSGGAGGAVPLPGHIPSPATSPVNGDPAAQQQLARADSRTALIRSDSAGGYGRWLVEGSVSAHGSSAAGASAAGSSSGDGGGDDSTAGAFNPFHRADNPLFSPERQAEVDLRRSHFHARIRTLGGRLKVLETDYYNVARHRDKLLKLLHDADRRRRLLAAEWEVVRDFKGLKIDSSVVHGRRQVFEVRELRGLISTELVQLDASCTTLRGLVVETIGQVLRAQAAALGMEEAVKERKAALVAFEKAEQRKERLVQLVHRIGVDFLGRCFYAWREHVAEMRRIKKNFVKALLRWLHMAEARGFNTWRRAVAGLRAAEEARALEVQAASAKVLGIGSLVLSEAETLRMSLAKDAAGMVAYVQGLETELHAQAASLGQRKLATAYAGQAAVGATHDLPGLPFDVATPLPPELMEYVKAPAIDPLAHHGDGRGGGAGSSMGGGSVFLSGSASMSDMGSSSSSRGDGLTGRSGASGSLHSGAPRTMRGVDFTDSMLLPDAASLRAAGTSMAIVPLPSTLQGRRAYGRPHLKGGRRVAMGELPGLDDEISALRATFRGADPLAAHLIAQLRLGAYYVEDGNYVGALPLLRQCELVFGYFKDGPGLLATYRLISSILDRLQRHDLAYVYWDRCARIAEEVRHDLAFAEAKEGVGRALGARGDVEGCLACFQRAEEVYEQRGDRHACARVYRALVAPLRALHRNTEADQYAQRASDIESHGSMALAAARARLLALHDRLVADSAKQSRFVHLESCGVLVPLLRNQEQDVRREIRAMTSMTATLTGEYDKLSAKLAEYKAESKRIEHLPLLVEVESAVLNRAPRKYVVEALREELAAEAGKLVAAIGNLAERRELVARRCRNAQAALDDLQKHLQAETSALLRRVLDGLQLRCVSLNPVNVKVNDVLGIGTGGLNRIASASNDTIYQHSTADGRCTRALISVHAGGARQRDTIGHTKLVTCVGSFANCIYTGSADGTVCAWDGVTRARYDGRSEHESPFEWEMRDVAAAGHVIADGPDLRRAAKQRSAGLFWTATPHTATVTNVGASAAFVVSGGSDSLIVVSEAATGAPLRRLRSHESGVSCLSVHDRTFASAGADRVVYLWLVAWEDGEVADTLTVTQGMRFEGHIAPITAVYCLGNDVVSGDGNGEVILWNAATGAPMVRHQVHKPGHSVWLLQNDALKVVTYGSDERLVVTDLMQGTAMQETIQPHAASRMLALQFDTDTMVTVAADRTMRVWAWKAGRFSSRPREVADRPAEHIIKPDEQLQDVAEAYELSVRELLTFNRMGDARRLYPGMRLSLYPPVEEEGGGAARGRRAMQAVVAVSAGARPGRRVFNPATPRGEGGEMDGEEEGGEGDGEEGKEGGAGDEEGPGGPGGGKVSFESKAGEAAATHAGAGKASTPASPSAAGASGSKAAPRPPSAAKSESKAAETDEGWGLAEPPSAAATIAAAGGNIVDITKAALNDLELMSRGGATRKRGIRLGADAVDAGTAGAAALGAARTALRLGAALRSARTARLELEGHMPSAPTDPSLPPAPAPVPTPGVGGRAAGPINMRAAAAGPAGRHVRLTGPPAPVEVTAATSTLKESVGALRSMQARGGADAEFNSLRRKLVSMKQAAAASADSGIAGIGAASGGLQRRRHAGFSSALADDSYGAGGGGVGGGGRGLGDDGDGGGGDF